MQVPFVDLKRQYRKLAAEVEKAVQETLSNCAYIMGPEVRAFEEAFAEYSRAAHAVGVANGTDAIEIMIRALNIGPGDEVIIPANTFIASAVGIMRTGASPILVDCDEKHLLLDPGLVPPALTDSCRAILGVHLLVSRWTPLPYSSWPRRVNWIFSKMPARHTGQSITDVGPEAWAGPRLSASILGKIWAPMVTGGLSPPTMRR